jgi:23S rRNA (cytidine1920-2'-O)/16S rRNA (cytidine1409-2'-O)-methyltransferase
MLSANAGNDHEWNIVPEVRFMSGARQRADRLLVERGIFESRAKAQAAIEAGLVTANGQIVRKASEEIPTDASLRATAAHPYVSRGGIKLAAALDSFVFDPRNHICLDVGASTGGFTHVLLDRGARRVYAIDVGRGQLHETLRARPEIVSLEATDIRNVSAVQFDEPPDFLTIDVSFISLKAVLPPATALLKTPAKLVALIKPQFEAGAGAAKKGIVRDPALHAVVCEDIAKSATSLGWRIVAIIPSPIQGGDGNAEFLLGAERD